MWNQTSLAMYFYVFNVFLENIQGDNEFLDKFARSGFWCSKQITVTIHWVLEQPQTIPFKMYKPLEFIE